MAPGMCKRWSRDVWFSLLAVLVPPAIADEPTDFLVTREAPAVMTCTASGLPVPSIHWTKNGIRLLPRGDGYRILSSGNKAYSVSSPSLIGVVSNGQPRPAFCYNIMKRGGALLLKSNYGKKEK